MPILPPRPLRGSGKAAQTARKPDKMDGKSLIPTPNHFSADLGNPKNSLLLELLMNAVDLLRNMRLQVDIEASRTIFGGIEKK